MEKSIENLSINHITVMSQPEFAREKIGLEECSEIFGVSKFIIAIMKSKDKRCDYLTEILSAIEIAAQNEKLPLPVFIQKSTKPFPLYEGYFSHNIANIHFSSEPIVEIPKSKFKLNLSSLLNSIGFKAEIKSTASRVCYSIKVNTELTKRISNEYNMLDELRIFIINNNYKDKGNIISIFRFNFHERFY